MRQRRARAQTRPGTEPGWVTAWATSVQDPLPTGTPTGSPPLDTRFPDDRAADQSVRLVVRPLAGAGRW